MLLAGETASLRGIQVRYLEDWEDAPKDCEWVKKAKTIFRKINYHEPTGTSTVDAWIVTGRTHQIRVHLLSLGHPIVNDPDYGWSASKRTRKSGLQESDMTTCEECGASFVSDVDAVKSNMIYLHAWDYTACDPSNGDTNQAVVCESDGCEGCGKWDADTGTYYFHTAPPAWLDDDRYQADFFGSPFYEPYFPGGKYCAEDVYPQKTTAPNPEAPASSPLDPSLAVMNPFAEVCETVREVAEPLQNPPPIPRTPGPLSV